MGPMNRASQGAPTPHATSSPKAPHPSNGGGIMAKPAAQPAQGTASAPTSPHPMSPTGGSNSPLTASLEQHLDSLPDDAKQYLANMLTPEFATAMGIVMGPEVGSFFMKHADPNKILVAEPRPQSPQGPSNAGASAAPAPSAGTPAKPAGMMAPTSQPQPNPSAAPSQGGM